MGLLRKTGALAWRWKWVLAGCAAVAGLVVWSVAWRLADKSAKPMGETATVTKGPLDITVEAKGELEASETVKIFPEISWSTLTFVIKDGTDVKKGELLAKLDGDRFEQDANRVSIDVERRRNQLIQAEEQLRIAKVSAETRLADARLGAEKARMAIEQYGTVTLTDDGLIDESVYASAEDEAKGEAYQKFRDASLAIERARTGLETAQRDAQGMDALLTKGFVTRQEYISAELAVEEGERRLESALLSHNILKAYTYPMELEKVKQAFANEKNELRKTELSTSVDLSSAESRLRMARRSYEERQRYLDELKDQLGKCTITAPVDGKVLYGDGNPWWKDEIAVGRHVWQGMRLFTIPNTKSIIGKVRVLEIDVYQVKVAQTVRVTMDALAGVTLEGKVSKVAEYASSQGWRWGAGQNTKVFEVEFKFDQDDERLKPGMSCTSEILTDSIPDTIYVPVLAVFNKDGKQICYLVDGQETNPVEVRTGRASEKFVEILEGLQSGQRVLLAESSPSDKVAGKGGS